MLHRIACDREPVVTNLILLDKVFPGSDVTTTRSAVLWEAFQDCCPQDLTILLRNRKLLHGPDGK